MNSGRAPVSGAPFRTGKLWEGLERLNESRDGEMLCSNAVDVQI